MSALMNALSGIVYSDYIQPLKLYEHTERNANITMKALVVLTGLYCVAMGPFVEQFSTILQMVMTIAGVTSGASMGVFCLGMLWPWANKKGALTGIIVSIVIMFWIVVNAQILVNNKELVYPPLPSSVENCELYGINVTNIITSTVNATQVPAIGERPFNIYRLSFVWYGFLGTFITIIVGVIVSWMTGGEDIKKIGSRLIAPVAHFMLPPGAFVTEVPLETIVRDEKTPATVQIEKPQWDWNVKDKDKQ